MIGKLRISREHVAAAVGVILRVPALFILEAWYKTDPDKLVQDTTKDMEILSIAIYYSAAIFAVILATLPLKKLVALYMYLVSAGVVAGAYYLSEIYVEVEADSRVELGDSLLAALRHYDTAQRLVLHLSVQCILAAIVSCLLDIKDWRKFLLLIFTAPMIARVSGLPARDLQAVHNFSTIFCTLMSLLFVFNNSGHGFDIIRSGINDAREVAREFGWLPVGITFWHTIMLPVQLTLFWILMFITQVFVLLTSRNISIKSEGIVIVLLASVGESCTTPISLFALCTVVSYLSYYALTLTKLFLVGRDGLVQDNDLLRGWAEGFTLLLIAIQTGLLDLKPLERAFLMCILLFIVVSSLIQSMYEITEPILLALSASHSKSKFKHLRAVGLCTFLWMFPLYMTYSISSYFDLDFWLMIIISSCVLTSVQVIGSLLIYWLFLYDAWRTEPWEKLDDIIYYIRSAVCVLEFVVAVFVVFYGVKESLFGEWSWINSFILMIHCYFNVWVRLQNGWKSFLQRREAVEKLESLPEATGEQLQSHNDLCAICFQEMNTARITACGHFFHGCCLRKWLYVKDACPMCHHPINEAVSRDELNIRTEPGNVVDNDYEQADDSDDNESEEVCTDSDNSLSEDSLEVEQY